ncbi:tRNA-intron endonuclease [Phytophthora cinnamomi]|uniref:tRNA-intron endonuclease n=1 Tax=Phytophthora cinnamomi TaxID=4785 RepID=UPI00355A93ED|nr:tRNA-intron endonuclease [Phytophthora cinnamomi]
MNVSVATVVAAADADATYALVAEPQHVAFLQQECRVYGSPEGTALAAAAAPLRLRLALEEMALGVVKGFLRLEAPLAGSTGGEAVESEAQKVVKEITEELRGNTLQREDGAGVTWRLSSRRRARLRVFRDLWERGYVVTFGSKFGADFLIYKDNPKHAHAVALVVVKNYEEEFARVDVVSFCRVAKMVKKQLLFACVRDNGEDKRSDAEEKGEGDENEEIEVAAGSVVYISLTHALLVSRQEEC